MSAAAGADGVPAEVIGGHPSSAPGRTRSAYVADQDLSAAILARLSEILSWDHSTGASIAGRGLPLRWRVPTDGVGCDREPVGFDEPTGPTPEGLERLAGRDYLTPLRGADGDGWRVLLGEGSARPRLSRLLAEHGVPATIHCRETAALHRVRMLPPAAHPVLDDPGHLRPAMLLWTCCEPRVPAVLTPCPSWEFDMAVELTHGASAEGR